MLPNSILFWSGVLGDIRVTIVLYGPYGWHLVWHLGIRPFTVFYIERFYFPS